MYNRFWTGAIALLLISNCCLAQDAAQPQAPTDDLSVPCDTQIFKRTPVIDGSVEGGEWDVFFTHDSAEGGMTAYADWDDDNLYFAAKASKPVDYVLYLDARSDGWFHGDDNFELQVTQGSDGSPALSVSRYDSKNSKSPVATPVSAAETGLIAVKSAVSESSYSLEIRIPKSVLNGSIKLADGRGIGLHIAAKPGGTEASAWLPANDPGSVKECTLVSKKLAALEPLEVGFDLRDAKIARGDDLVGKFHITNKGGDSVDVYSFVIAGEGKAGEYLSSQKVRLEKILPGRHISHDIRSIIPSDMPLGSWAVGAEVKSPEKRLGGALISFEVVEPIEVKLVLPEKDVKSDVKDVTVGIAITNNRRGEVRGTVKVLFPLGWELWKNADTREFRVAGGGAITTVSFKAKPPLGALGDIPVKFDVMVDGFDKSIEGAFNVINP